MLRYLPSKTSDQPRAIGGHGEAIPQELNAEGGCGKRFLRHAGKQFAGTPAFIGGRFSLRGHDLYPLPYLAFDPTQNGGLGVCLAAIRDLDRLGEVAARNLAIKGATREGSQFLDFTGRE